MGGQAAFNMIDVLKDKNDNQNLKYARAQSNGKYLDEVRKLTDYLSKANLITDSEPTYALGSTRIFAIKTGLMEPAYNDFETPTVVDIALENKTSFGDIDLDVNFTDGITVRDVQSYLNESDKYHACLTGSEANVAVTVEDSDEVIQIDIMDISHARKSTEISQFSSMLDMANGLKGAVRDLLFRSIASTHPIQGFKKEAMVRRIKTTDAYANFEKKNAGKNIDFEIKYSFAAEGLIFRVSWLADDKKKAYTQKGVAFDRFANLGINNFSNAEFSYEDEEGIANVLGVKDFEQLKHSVSMLQFIETFSAERKQAVLDAFVKGLRTKVPFPPKRPIGIMTNEEVIHSLKFALPYLDGADTTEAEEFLESLNKG